jgi:hypothetical protein
VLLSARFCWLICSITETMFTPACYRR